MYRPLGTGDVDIAAIVNTLQGNGYDGWYTLEQDTILTEEPRGEGPGAATSGSAPTTSAACSPTRRAGPSRLTREDTTDGTTADRASSGPPASPTWPSSSPRRSPAPDWSPWPPGTPPRATRSPKPHGIERVHESYLDVINDPEVEAVYNPLANSLHAPWNKAAIAAGKHVFTEKPSASNATEAEEVAAQVARHRSAVLRGLPLPLAPADRAAARHSRQRRARRTAARRDRDGHAGTRRHRPRWSLELGGGALMDLGCYSLHSMRILAPFVGGEPTLVSATGGERPGHPGVDEWLTAELQFPNGVTGTAGCNMASDHHQMSHRLIGSAGEAVITDFVNPHNDDRLIVTTSGRHPHRTPRQPLLLHLPTRGVHHGDPHRRARPHRRRRRSQDHALIDTCYEARSDLSAATTSRLRMRRPATRCLTTCRTR